MSHDQNANLHIHNDNERVISVTSPIPESVRTSSPGSPGSNTSEQAYFKEKYTAAVPASNDKEVPTLSNGTTHIKSETGELTNGHTVTQENL